MPKRDRDQELAIARAFGQRVREVRNTRGMTQEQLAEAAELHPTFISNIERGYRVPTLPTIIRLAGGLETTAADLIEGIEG